MPLDRLDTDLPLALSLLLLVGSLGARLASLNCGKWGIAFRVIPREGSPIVLDSVVVHREAMALGHCRFGTVVFCHVAGE